jgi:hypothetical protein
MILCFSLGLLNFLLEILNVLKKSVSVKPINSLIPELRLNIEENVAMGF